MNKQQLILSKAKELFMKYGIRSISMDDLARELGISKKTLYQHIKDKKELIRQIMEYDMEEFNKKVENITENAENAMEVIVKINEEMLKIISQLPSNVKYDLKKYYPDIADNINKEMDKKMFEAIVKNIKRGQKEGIFRKDIVPEIIAKLQIIRSKALFNGSYQDIEASYSKAEIIKETFKYHIYGITTKKGLQIYKELQQKK